MAPFVSTHTGRDGNQKRCQLADVPSRRASRDCRSHSDKFIFLYLANLSRVRELTNHQRNVLPLIRHILRTCLRKQRRGKKEPEGLALIKVINQARNKSPSRGIHLKLSQLPRRIAQTYVYIYIVSSFCKMKPCGSSSATPRLYDVGTTCI